MPQQVYRELTPGQVRVLTRQLSESKMIQLREFVYCSYTSTLAALAQGFVKGNKGSDMIERFTNESLPIDTHEEPTVITAQRLASFKTSDDKPAFEIDPSFQAEDPHSWENLD